MLMRPVVETKSGPVEGLIEELEFETDYKINKMNVMLSKINKNKDLNV